MPKYLVFVERNAQKQLEKLPKDAHKRIVEALHTLQDEGFSIKLDM